MPKRVATCIYVWRSNYRRQDGRKRKKGNGRKEGKKTTTTHLLGLRPLRLGQELVGGAGLEGAAQAVDAVVGLLGREALQGLDDLLVLLDDQVVGPVRGVSDFPRVSNPSFRKCDCGW